MVYWQLSQIPHTCLYYSFLGHGPDWSEMMAYIIYFSMLVHILCPIILSPMLIFDQNFVFEYTYAKVHNMSSNFMISNEIV
jgi:hypothetical protein